MTVHNLLMLAFILLLLGGILWAGFAALMAWTILRPPRMSAGKAIYRLRRLSPGDLGLRFEEEVFTVHDSQSGKPLNMAAWWIPAAIPSESCVILLHGYADAKVGAIAWAPLLHDLNLNILAIDLRAHGDSQGRFSTGGYFERDDVNQIINQLTARRSQATRGLMLFGISLGAAVACGVAVTRDDISAIILDSPFTGFSRAIAAHGRLMRLPGGILLRTAIGLSQWLSGAKFDEVRPVDLLPRVTCPVLTIVGMDDILLEPTDIAALKQAAEQQADHVQKSRFWTVPEAGHIAAMPLDPIEYQRQIQLFLQPIYSV